MIVEILEWIDQSIWTWATSYNRGQCGIGVAQHVRKTSAMYIEYIFMIDTSDIALVHMHQARAYRSRSYKQYSMEIIRMMLSISILWSLIRKWIYSLDSWCISFYFTLLHSSNLFKKILNRRELRLLFSQNERCKAIYEYAYHFESNIKIFVSFSYVFLLINFTYNQAIFLRICR